MKALALALTLIAAPLLAAASTCDDDAKAAFNIMLIRQFDGSPAELLEAFSIFREDGKDLAMAMIMDAFRAP